MESFDLESILAIVMSLGIPIVAVAGAYIVAIKKKKNETELRKAIVENHLDAESIKLLIEEQQPKSNKFTMLRWGCILVGGGLGALCKMLFLHSEAFNSLSTGIFVALGMGLGMLTAFILEYQMQKKENANLRNADEQSRE